MRIEKMAVLVLMAFASVGVNATVVQLDTANPQNGIFDIYSATFDPARQPCGPSSPTYCAFFRGDAPAVRRISIGPNPTGLINGVPAGILPIPVAGSYLDLTLAADNSAVTIGGGTIALPTFSLVIAGNSANPTPTVFTASGVGFVINAAPQTVPIDANRRAEFRVDLAPGTAADFTTLSVVVQTCSGPLCPLVQILTFDMVRYRLVLDYDASFSTFTGLFMGQTANNSEISANLNSVPLPPAAFLFPSALVALGWVRRKQKHQ